MSIYFDKHGRQVEKWMTMRHDNGDVCEVVQTTNQYGEDDLGFSCSAREAYPLWQFDMSEWEIIEDEG